MIKNVNVNELLFSDLLVKDSVDEVNGKLTTDTTQRKVILASGRGSGKSVILSRREIDGLNTKEPAILTRFDASGIFGNKENKYFTRECIEHYYEVVMAKKLLNFIKEYYPDLYLRKFTRINDVTSERLLEVDRYINGAGYRGVSLKQTLFSGESVSEIMSLFRQGTGAESVTLMIDRFDWTHNSDSRVQNILKNYFEMFEKVFITSDDPTIMVDKKLNALLDKGYEVVDFGYSSDPSVVRKIVEARFSLDEEDEESKFPVEMISDEDYQKLVERCCGNISTILDTVREAEVLYQWSGDDFDMSSTLDSACTDKLNGVKSLRKISKPPKLHL